MAAVGTPSPINSTTQVPPASIKHIFNPSDWLFIASALSSSSAVLVIPLNLVGRVSFVKPFGALVLTSIVLNILAEMFKDQTIDVTPVIDAFTPKPVFHTDLYPGEGVVNPHLAPGGVAVVPLINRGADCFMNATLQAIMHDQPLKDALLRRYQGDTTPQAVAFCRAVQFYSDGKTVSTFNLRQFMPADIQFGQQDAYEFLQQLLNGLTPRDHPDLFLNRTTTYFWQQRDDRDQVLNKKQTTVAAAEFNSILEVPKQDEIVSGQQLIDNHFAKQPHEGEMWMDGNDAYSPFQQQIQLDRDAKRLVFVLKRFSRYAKISTPVDMPEELIVDQKRYLLKRVIIHHGSSMSYGHYTALLNIGGKWISASDTYISESTNTAADRQNGYIYFYELKQLVE